MGLARTQFLLVSAVVFAATSASPAGYGLAENGEATPRPSSANLDTDPITATIQSLPLQARVSQLMIVTLEGAIGPASSDLALLRYYPPGGVVIPGVSKPTAAAKYVAALRKNPLEIQINVPLLIGANIWRLPEHPSGGRGMFSQLPTLLSLAAANDADSTSRLGGLIATQLTTMGFNMHVGPSLELAPTLPGAKGTVHCLGADPEFAAAAGAGLVEALLDNGVVAIPMGFPGGGGNKESTGPAMLLTPRPLLAECDLLPFRRAIEKGAPTMHVGNTLVPMLDEDNLPASLSATVMKDLLRHELGFKGVIVAGPMDAADLSRNRSPARAAVDALKAGADMIYWNEAGRLVMKAVDTIVAAVDSGDISELTINAALERVLKLKRDFGLLEREPPKVSAAEALERKRKYPEEAYLVERRAVTVVLNREGILPLRAGKPVPVVITGIGGVGELHDALETHIKDVAQRPMHTAKHGGQILNFEIERLTSRILGGIVICVFPDTVKTAGQVRLIRELKAKGAGVVVVLLGYPENVGKLAGADALVLAYSDGASVSETMRAVADVLAGQGPLRVLSADRNLEAAVGDAIELDVLDFVQTPAGRLPVSIEDPFLAGFAVPCDISTALKKADWDFGDGQRASRLEVAHVYKSPGRYPVTLTVTDRKGGTTSGTFHVVVE